MNKNNPFAQRYFEVKPLIPTHLSRRTSDKILLDSMENLQIPAEFIVNWHSLGHHYEFPYWLEDQMACLNYVEREFVLDFLLDYMDYNILHMKEAAKVAISWIMRGGH